MSGILLLSLALRPAPFCVHLGFALVGAVACKREPDPVAAAGPPDRRSRCVSIADDVAKMGMMLARGLSAGLSEGKSKLEGAQEAALVAELEATKVELIEHCLEWPEEALDCFGFRGVTSSAKCERIVSAAMGEAVLPDDVPAGPAVAWRFELPHELSALIGRDDGTAIAVVAPESPGPDEPEALVIAVNDGTERWRRELPSEPFVIEPYGSAALLAVSDHALHAIDADHGQLLWSSQTPEGTDGRVELIAVAQRNNDLFVLDRRGVLARVPTKGCASAAACLEATATLDVPPTDGTRWLEPGPALGWIVVDADDGVAHVLDTAGKRRFSVAAHTTLSWADTVGGDLRLGLDGAVVVLDTPRCGDQGREFSPVTWPPQRKAKWVADATVRELEVDVTPTGCVRWQAELGVAEGSDPVPPAGGDTLLHAGGFLFAFDAVGAAKFKTPVTAMSFVVATAGGLAVVGDMGGDSLDLVVTWLNTDGKHLRRSSVPLAAGKLLLFDDVALHDAGDAIVLGLERSLVAFEG